MKMISDNYTIQRRDRHYRGFITRRDFINRTGIYMTEKYYLDICYEFHNSGKTVDEFMEDFEKNVKDSVIETTMQKTFRYMRNDERISRIEDYNFLRLEDGATVYEVLDSLVVDCEQKEDMLEELCSILWELVWQHIKHQTPSVEILDRMKDYFAKYNLLKFDCESICQESEKLKVKSVEYDENQKPKRVILTHEDRLNDYMYQYSVEAVQGKEYY